MKLGSVLLLLVLSCAQTVVAQVPCRSFEYQQSQVKQNPSLNAAIQSVEKFTQQHNGSLIAKGQSSVIRIPVVVHVLYHTPDQKISDKVVYDQLDILNKCFRHLNSDTVNIPSTFKALAADCEIEFQLATSDPKQRNTTGIVKKYTPITKWINDDKMKFSADMGDDEWDPNSYLNIWVCALDNFAGYSSVVGGPADVDGVVIGFPAFGAGNKTAVHEIGHWLNLKHLWGDDYCGDDGVDDTPKQASFTIGCPSGVRITCGNAPTGDMYMNYMDFTNDACMHLFSLGQKARMRALFLPGGPRYALLSSTGLNPPLIYESPLPEDDPKWLEPKIFPNPATNEVDIDLSYDTRWIGQVIQITNLQGQTLMLVTITSKLQKIDISRLPAGIYFLAAKKQDGVSMKQKFIKL